MSKKNSNTENNSQSDKKLNVESLLKEAQLARLRLREAGVEADRYKEKFEKAIDNANSREAELLEQNEGLSNRVSEADLSRQAVEQKCILLEDQLKSEREKFFKQENDLLVLNQQNRHRTGEERRGREEFEKKLEDERASKESLLAEVLAAKEEIATAADERRKLEHEISVINSKYEKTIQKEKESVKELAIAAEREKSRAEALQQESRDGRATIEELQKKIVDFSDSKVLLESRLESEITKRQRIAQEAAQTEERLVVDQHKYQEEAHVYQGKLLSARHDMAELEVRYERLSRKYNRTKFDYRRDRTELLGEFSSLQKELKVVNLKLRDTEKQMNVEKRVASNQVDQLRSQMRNALSQSEREKHDLSRQLDVLLKDAEDVRRRAEGFDVEVAEIREGYEDKIKSVEGEFERVSGALQKTAKAFEDESRRNEKLNEQTVNMRKLLEDLEKRMRDSQAENQEVIKASNKKYDELYDDHENIKRILQDAVDEKNRSDGKLAEVKEEEVALRGVVKNLRKEVEQMQESVSASSASKAYLKEKYEAVDSALSEVKALLVQEKESKVKAEEKLRLEREAFTKVEKQLRTNIVTERDQLESQHSREVGSYREEIDTLLKERDIAREELVDERVRNQELLQNLLTMREELELTHEASSAAKVFLKEKLAKSEENLEEYKSEFLLEEQRRQELEKQLRELRRKMEFA